MKKRFLSILLAACLLLSVLPAGALAAGDSSTATYEILYRQTGSELFNVMGGGTNYNDEASGNCIRLTKFVDSDEYMLSYFVEYTGSSIEKVFDYSSEYGFEPPDYIGDGTGHYAVETDYRSGKYKVLDMYGNMVTQTIYSHWLEAKKANHSGGYFFEYDYDTKLGTVKDRSGKVVLTDAGKPYRIQSDQLPLMIGYPWPQVSKEGLLPVCNNAGNAGDWTANWGYANLSGELVIPFAYGAADNFKNGYAVVWEKDDSVDLFSGRRGLIDTKGNVIIPFGTFDRLSNVSDTGILWAYNWLGEETYELFVLSIKNREEKTARPTNDALAVNGVETNPTVYKIDGSNFFKIRDVAAMLNGTEKQFAVGYENGKVTVTSGQPYQSTGTELKGAPAGAGSAVASNDKILINGRESALTVYKIDGSNFFMLRDLGKALDFYVGWTAERGVFIETDKPYSE